VLIASCTHPLNPALRTAFIARRARNTSTANMHTDSSAHETQTGGLASRGAWIGPVWGFACSVTTTVIWRVLDLEYRREISSAVILFVSVLVTTHYNGRLGRRPLVYVAFAVVSAVWGFDRALGSLTRHVMPNTF
jgi:hypothetical protein